MSGQQLVLADHRSRFAVRARTLDPGLLSALKIEPVIIQVADVAVTICSVLMDADDDRPWSDRLDNVFQDLDEDLEAVLGALKTFSKDETYRSLEAWVRKLRQVSYQAYARRLLGAAEYDLLERALREDAAVVVLAVRRGVRALMPFVVAFEDGLSVMTEQQLSQVRAADLVHLNLGQLINRLDASIGDRVMPSLPMDTVVTREGDFASLSELSDEVRAKVSSSALSHLTRVNEPLVRKLTGARDALEYSADGVSQAANSLIELIDRILRDSAPSREMLEWIGRELPDVPDLIYLTKDGAERPTTRGSALFFLYGAGSVARQPTEHDDGTGPSLIHDVVASVVVAARNKLQKLKHEDRADPTEREQLGRLLAAVEGAMLLGLWFQQLTSVINGDSAAPELSA